MLIASEGCQARRPACGAADHARVRYQFEDARALGLEVPPSILPARRRGDRVGAPPQAGAIQPVKVRPK